MVRGAVPGSKGGWVLVRDARGDIFGIRSRAEQQPWVRVPQRLGATDLPAAQQLALHSQRSA